jgi:hypothetical protein
MRKIRPSTNNQPPYIEVTRAKWIPLGCRNTATLNIFLFPGLWIRVGLKIDWNLLKRDAKTTASFNYRYCPKPCLNCQNSFAVVMIGKQKRFKGLMKFENTGKPSSGARNK